MVKARDVNGFDIELNEEGIWVYSLVNGSDQEYSERITGRKVHFDNLPSSIADKMETPEESNNPWF